MVVFLGWLPPSHRHHSGDRSDNAKGKVLKIPIALKPEALLPVVQRGLPAFAATLGYHPILQSASRASSGLWRGCQEQLAICFSPSQ